jgi:predicted N-acetyltransferase YhbS
MDRANVDLVVANANAVVTDTDFAADSADIVATNTRFAAAIAEVLVPDTDFAAARAEIALRAMTPSDCRAVAALIRTAFAVQPTPTDPPASALRETETTIGAHLAAGGGAVACAGGRIVGSVMWEPKDGGMYLQRLAVEPAWRGQGIARALVAATEAAARRAGVTHVHLGTRLVLAGNRRLFASCGFVEIAQHAHPGYAAPTWVEMEKRLEPQAAAL